MITMFIVINMLQLDIKKSLRRDLMKRQRLASLLATLLFAFSCLPAQASITTNIWNNPAQTIGTTNWLNADGIANLLGITNFHTIADNDLNVLDVLDLRSGIFGSATGRLFLVAPLLNIDHDIKMGSGQFRLGGSTLNLGGRILNSDNSLRSLSGFDVAFDSPTTVNVTGNTASIQQANDVSNNTTPVTINVASGNYAENLSGLGSNIFNFNNAFINGGISGDLFVGNGSIVDLAGGVSGGLLSVGDSALVNLFGSNFELDTGSGFVPIGSGEINRRFWYFARRYLIRWIV